MRDPGARLLQQLDDQALSAVMDAVLLVANADGNFGEEEIRFFRRCFGALVGGRLDESQFAHAQSRLERELAQDGAGGCVQRIARFVALPAAREAALILAHDMAMADGELAAGERQTLLMLASAFGVEDNDRHELFEGPVQLQVPSALRAQTS